MKVETKYLNVVLSLTWNPRNLVILQHEDENIVYACQPGMSAWLATPTMPEDAKLSSIRCVPVDVHLGLHWLGDWFTWNDLILRSLPYSRTSPRQEISTFKEFDGYPLEHEVLRRWLDQQQAFASLSPLQPVERYGNPFACVFLAPFQKLLPLVDEAGSIRTVFIPDEHVEIFGFSLTFPGNVRISCSTACVFRYPPVIDEDSEVAVE